MPANLVFGGGLPMQAAYHLPILLLLTPLVSCLPKPLRYFLIGLSLLCIMPRTFVLVQKAVHVPSMLGIFLWRLRSGISSEIQDFLAEQQERIDTLITERNDAYREYGNISRIYKELKLRNRALDEKNNTLELKMSQTQKNLDSTTENLLAHEGAVAGQDLRLLRNDLEYMKNVLRGKDSVISTLNLELQSMRTKLTFKIEENKQVRMDLDGRSTATEAEKTRLLERCANLQSEKAMLDGALTVYKQVVDVLHDMAATNDPECLPAAVAVAKMLELRSVNLRALEIDQERLKVLSTYVANGMGPQLSVQPQRYEPGFRFRRA